MESLGHRGEIIDYTSPPHRYNPVRHAVSLNYRLVKRWPNWLDAIIKDRCFARARRTHLKRSKRILSRNYLSQFEYDAVLVGSDIVWNFKDTRLGNDPVYFGAELNTEKLIGFAPSFGACNLGDTLPDYVCSGLRKFSAIAVRDKNSADICEAVLGKRPQVICDPSFHLIEDLRVDEIDDTCGDYILLYMRISEASATFVNEIKKLREHTGLPIYAVYYRVNWANKNFMNVDPFEWVQMIRKAKYVFTNTFHGTVFSVLTKCEFVVELNESIRNKTIELVNNSELRYRNFNGKKPLTELLEYRLDFGDIHKRFRTKAREAKSFLKSALIDNR